jgi:hypothetical protein
LERPQSSPLSAAERRRRFPWLVLLAIIPAAAPLLLLKRYQVNLVWNDAWDLAALLIKSHQGILGISDFFVPHNEHLMPVPYALMYALAKLTGWDLRIESLVGYGFVWILAAGLAMLARSVDGSNHRWGWAWLVMVLLVFSPMQVENWMFGFCAVQNFLPVPCLVWAMVFIRRSHAGLLSISLSGLLAAVASLSLANGLMHWILIVPVIVASASPHRRWRALALWIALMSATLLIYVLFYRSPELAADYYSAPLAARVKFFLIFLGLPLTYGLADVTNMGILAGGAIVTMCLLMVGWIALAIRTGGRQIFADSLPWLAIGAYGLGGAALGAIGRAGLGAGQAAVSRYTTISGCVLIGIIGLLLVTATLTEPRRWRRLAVATLSIISLAVFFSGIRSIPNYVNANQHSRTALAHLTLINQHMDARTPLLIAYREDLRELANGLDQAGYLHPPLVSDPDIAHLATSGQQALGAVERMQEIRPQVVRATGWGVLPDGNRAGDVVLITTATEASPNALVAIADINMDGPDINVAPGKQVQDAWWTADIPVPAGSQAAASLRFWVFDALAQEAYPLPVRSR